MSFRFTLSYTSSMLLPLTHSRNTFPLRTYSFQSLSRSLVLIISITHFSFQVFLSCVFKNWTQSTLKLHLGINNRILSITVFLRTLYCKMQSLTANSIFFTPVLRSHQSVLFLCYNCRCFNTVYISYIWQIGQLIFSRTFLILMSILQFIKYDIEDL
jgi:hypothetical protein